jgi:hypothetical protein
MLRKAAPMIDEQNTGMVAQIRSDPKRPEEGLLPFRWLAGGNGGNLAFHIEGIEVHVKISDCSPPAGFLVWLAGQAKRANRVFRRMCVSMRVRRIKADNDFDVSRCVEGGEILRNTKTA